MSRLAELQNEVLTSVENALREGDHVDASVLGSFNAGAEAIIRQNRAASDAELIALHNIADHVVGLVPEVVEQPASEGGVSVPSPDSSSEDISDEAPAASEAAGEPLGSEAEVTQPPAGEPAPAGPPDPDFSQPGERDIYVAPDEPLFGGEEAHDEPAEVEDDGA